MLRAYCKRFAGKVILVGDSVFPFDVNGYCEVEDTGYTYYDYVNLLKMNGVTKSSDKVEESVNEDESTTEEGDLSGEDKEEDIDLYEEVDLTDEKEEPKKEPSKGSRKSFFFKKMDLFEDEDEEELNDD